MERVIMKIRILLLSLISVISLQGMEKGAQGANKQLVVTWGSSTAQGDRPYNEDSLLCKKNPDGSYDIGIFDGHGGRAVSDFVADKLPSYLREASGLAKGSVEEKFNRAFFNIDYALSGYWYWGIRNQGTTAVVAHIDTANKKVHLVNTGDSRAVLKNNGTLLATDDHKPATFDSRKDMHRQKESDRVTTAGGKIMTNGGGHKYVYPSESSDYGLAMTRSLGDHRIKQINPKVIIHNPDTKSVSLTGDSTILVVACDGLWDVIGSEKVIEFIEANIAKSRSELEEEIRKKAVEIPENEGWDQMREREASGKTRGSLAVEKDRSDKKDDTNNLDLIAQLLVQVAALKYSRDNITVVVAKLDQKDVSELEKVDSHNSWDSNNKVSLIPSYHRPALLSITSLLSLIGGLAYYLKYLR